MTYVSQATSLLKKLDHQISTKQSSNELIEELQLIEDRRGTSDLDGLNEKLEAGERQDQIESAQIAKEMFAKLLAKMQHYPAAQELFAFFLARILDVFETDIAPYAAALTRQEVDQIIQDKIITPTLNDMGDGFDHFTLNLRHIRGMIYWLADKCYVRWS